MPTYNEICNRQDREHIARAKQLLGEARFMELAKVAKQAFHTAYINEQSKIKKPGAAKRAANLVYTSALRSN